MKLPTIEEAKVSGKKVFVRGDLDVPLAGGKISDDTRLENIWPTIEFLLKKGCTVYLAGHLGRPEGKTGPGLSSKPVAEWFLDKLSQPGTVNELGNFPFSKIGGYKIADNLYILENLRFDLREENNDEGFAKELATLAEIFVNESFAESYREVASISGVAKLLPHFAGLRLAMEIKVLSSILEEPKRPLLVIIGGAKLDTKFPVISQMAKHADSVIVGGKLLSEIMVGSEIMATSKIKLLKLTENEKDTTLESIDKQIFDPDKQTGSTGTIVWNGPVGEIEDFTYQVGTRRIAELIAGSKAYKVIGGGDTVGFVHKLGLLDKFDWVCSGGGAMLKFLAGEKLPGIEVLLS